MKMVKSLLLGGAAGLLAVAGAQAADMPVKAKAVAYVKICSLYGDGFYYIPGTDTCLKISGYVRNQHYFAYGSYISSATNGAFFGNGTNTRAGGNTDYIIRSRTSMYFDARTQTEYGTLRSVLSVGFTYDSPGSTASAAAGINPYANRAFIQIAGFTFGQAQSFYDFFAGAAVSYFGLIAQSDTGDGGWKVAAYTAQFGNGVSATLSLEETRRTAATSATAWGGLINANVAGGVGVVSAASQPQGNTGPGGTVIANQSYMTERMPDLVGVLRVDQAWGAAQLMGFIKDTSSSYYDVTAACSGAVISATGAANLANAVGTQNCGHPSDKLGWGVGVGLRINADALGKGDYFQMQATYTEGGLRYVSHTPGGGANASALSSMNVALGINADAVYMNNAGARSSVELTTAWGVAGSYEHNWNPNWKTSIYGTYMAVSFNTNAQTMLAANLTAGASCTVAGTICAAAGLAGTPNWQAWEVGTRTQWQIRGLYMGVDVLYRKLETGYAGTNFTYLSNTQRPNGIYVAKDHDSVVTTFRVHRDFPY